jgi:hypothetical protein
MGDIPVPGAFPELREVTFNGVGLDDEAVDAPEGVPGERRVARALFVRENIITDADDPRAPVGAGAPGYRPEAGTEKGEPVLEQEKVRRLTPDQISYT